MGCILNKIDEDYEEYLKFCKENNFENLYMYFGIKKTKFKRSKFETFYQHWEYLKRRNNSWK
jgi:hypothetical protein